MGTQLRPIYRPWPPPVGGDGKPVVRHVAWDDQYSARPHLCLCCSIFDGATRSESDALGGGSSQEKVHRSGPFPRAPPSSLLISGDALTCDERLSFRRR